MIRCFTEPVYAVSLASVTARQHNSKRMSLAVSFPSTFEMIWGCCAAPIIGLAAIVVLLSAARLPRTLSRAIALASALLTLVILGLWLFAPRYLLHDFEAGGVGWRFV